MSRNRDENQDRTKHTEVKKKKPYTAPELVAHGIVEKITENSQHSGSVRDTDGGLTAKNASR